MVFAFFFQGDVLGEAASDELSQLGAAMISAWGVVALAKETWAPEAGEFLGKRRGKYIGKSWLSLPWKVGKSWDSFFWDKWGNDG